MHLTANEASRKASEVRILHPPQFYRDMEQQNTIENSVASAILEKSIDNIDIEGVTYEIAPPSTATLILISEIVATLPVVKKVPAEEIVTSVLHYARYYRPIGDIAAVLILGAKNLIEYRTIVQEKRYLFGLIRRKTETTIKVDKKAEFFRHYHFPVRGKYPQTHQGSGKRLNDSIWATVLGIAKTLGVTEKYALYEISYVNAIMYSRAMPMPGDMAENSRPLYDDSKDANNPENFTDFTDDEEVVRI